MKSFALTLFACVILPFSVACGKSSPEPTPVESKISISTHSFNFPVEGGSESLFLSASGEWSAEVPSWIELSLTKGGKTDSFKIYVKVGKNTGEPRSAEVVFSLNDGKSDKLVVSQEGPGASSLTLSANSNEYSGDREAYYLKLSASLDWTLTCPDWLTVEKKSGTQGSNQMVVLIAQKNESGAERSGEAVFKLTDGKTAKFAVKQAKYTAPAGNPLEGKKLVVIANSMVYYGGLVQYGGQCSTDNGMFKKLMAANGVNATVYDCTYGGHHLLDFTTAGCKMSDKSCYGTDHLKSLDFKSFDYVIISEAGNNYSSFYNDAITLYRRFVDVNPKAKLVYINHIYSVYKSHDKVLGNLKNLYNNYGVTIVNVGQLGYDIYTKAVKVPGGSLTYSDRYTFCNHTSSDTYHPNPLMGYMMTQMLYCALTGTAASGTEYKNLIKNSYFAGGSVSYSEYYSKYYTTAAALPFMTVVDNAAEMAGIQQLIPGYVNKY